MLSEANFFLQSYLIGVMQNEYIRWQREGRSWGKNMGLKEQKAFRDDKHGLVGHIQGLLSVSEVGDETKGEGWSWRGAQIMSDKTTVRHMRLGG